MARRKLTDAQKQFIAGDDINKGLRPSYKP